jgi:ankyrin repeat protein
MGMKYTEDQKCLITAAREGQLDVVNELRHKGLDIDCELKYGSSALMIAASRGHNEIVRLMASAGAKVNRRNKFGISALSEAAERGHHKVLRTLVEFGADVVGGTVTVLDPADIVIAVTLDKTVCPSNAHGLLLTSARFSHFVVC